MAEAEDTLEPVAALDDADKFPLNDLPNDLLVSVFEAIGDLRYVRHTFSLVCKAWNELYCSQAASPLHETLEVNFYEEINSALARERARRGLGPVAGGSAERAQERARRRPVVHASSVISWAERRASWVRKLHLYGVLSGDFQEHFTSEDLSALVAAVGSPWTELRILENLKELNREPLIPAQISSLQKLEELTFRCCCLSSLPKELGELSGLRKVDLSRRDDSGRAPEDKAFPAELGNMRFLRELNLGNCALRAVPAFVSELESLEVLDLSDNDPQICATLDFLLMGCPRLRELRLDWPKTPESRAHLEAFKANLLAKNPNAEVLYLWK